LDGHGAIAAGEAAELVGHSHVSVEPVIDLAVPIQCPGYVASPRLKEHLALMNAGLCTFPTATNPQSAATSTTKRHIRGGRRPRPTPPAVPAPPPGQDLHRLASCDHHHRRLALDQPTSEHYLVTPGTTTPLR